MPTRRVVIIAIGTCVVILLFIFVFRAYTKKTATADNKTVMLSFAPAQLTASKSSKNSADIMVNTNGTKISGVQAILSYDPTVIQNIIVVPAADSLFGKTGEYMLFPDTVHTPGIARYTISINVNNQPHTGIGKIATVLFQINSSTQAHSTAIRFLGGKTGTLVTQLGNTTSVLKSASSLNIAIK